VVDVNHAPVVQNLNITTTINKAIKGLFTATDIDGEKQNFQVVKTTTHGTLKINGTQYIYTPTNNFNGTDSFTYKSNDGITDSNIAKITIAVTKIPTPVINTPQTPIKKPTSTYQTTTNTAKYTPTNTQSPLAQIKTPKNTDQNNANQNNTNMTAPQLPNMLTSLQNTPLQFIIPTIQKAANYIASILKI
jgi:Bacterial Ig domain